MRSLVVLALAASPALADVSVMAPPPSGMTAWQSRCHAAMEDARARMGGEYAVGKYQVGRSNIVGVPLAERPPYVIYQVYVDGVIFTATAERQSHRGLYRPSDWKREGEDARVEWMDLMAGRDYRGWSAMMPDPAGARARLQPLPETLLTQAARFSQIFRRAVERCVSTGDDHGDAT